MQAEMKILTELKEIKKELKFIKKHMVDPDTIMTAEESKRFEESLRELKDGKTTPLSKLRKELSL